MSEIRTLNVSFLAALAVQPALLLIPSVPWAFVIRPLPLFALAAGVARVVPLRRSWPVVLALVLGGAGDVAMTLRHHSSTAAPLLTGMGLFFLGHLAYSVVFFRERAYRPARAVWAAALVAVSLVAAAVMLPRLGALAAPVGVYAAGLTAMTALAALRGSPRPTVLAGAALFFLSDVLIGARLATTAVPVVLVGLVLPAYYLGQYWIARGWARDASSQAG